MAVHAHDRRHFLTGLGVLLVSPLVAEAQPAGKVPRVGLLLGLSPGPSREVDAFQRGLRELGYIEGQSIAIDYRYARGRVERLPELAAELVRLNPDVIVAPYTPPALAAKRATSSIPIVFAVVADAVGAGLIANLGRPGANITGLTSTSAELGGKRLELLKQVISKASRVAVLYNPADQSNVLILRQLQESAPNLGLSLQPLTIRGLGDFEGAFSAMARERTHAMFGAPGVLTFEHKEILVGLAARRRLPAMWGHRQFVNAGGLMSYAVNFYDQIRQTAVYVDKILKGAKPGDLPVEQPTRFELVINLKTAKALGLTIPQLVLLQADQVLE
ncbi:MAG TPA: ABC transporter substrate-binding protein [Gemmataceae bacterium]|nr:ABC transporter substrate-binding protein [Gemmataceae bacterium]